MSASPARPLAELSPMAQRRNSPSYNQVSKVYYDRLCVRRNQLTLIKKPILTENSSPFDSSPLASNSPRLYWQSRDPASPTRFKPENRNQGEQRDDSPSPSKRSSLENLKRASRVKNSNMFAREHKQEYDPSSSPMIERPLASGRPLSVQAQGNAYGGKGIEGLRNQQQQDASNIPSYIPIKSPGKLIFNPQPSPIPAKGHMSPAKSSLSSKSRYAQPQVYDPESGIWSDEEEPSTKRELPPGKSLHRHAKSVTFDAAPPQVNEYEMTTPDPSSVASGSREGSYDSADNEDDESFNRDSSIEHDDSFDASLEDTQKTPVVLPEDWRFMSPEVANDDLAAHVEDPFDDQRTHSASVTGQPAAINARSSPTRTDSVNSNGDRRPLPPLPGLEMPAFPRARSDSNTSLSATAERASSAQRILPAPPQPASITKSEIQGMGGCSMSIEDRLHLMMIQDEESRKSPGEEQREQHLRRGAHSSTPEKGIDQKASGIQIYEDEIEDNDVVADLEEYKLPPRISRESILRKVKSKRQMLDSTNDDDFLPSSKLQPSLEDCHVDDIDPDTPLPSLEAATMPPCDDDDVFIKQEDDELSEVDVYAIPDLYSQHLQAEAYTDYMDSRSSSDKQELARMDDDDQSHYSRDSESEEQRDLSLADAAGDEHPTPRAGSPIQAPKVDEQKASKRMSLPQFASMLGEQDFGFGLDSYLTPSPPLAQEPSKPTLSSDSTTAYEEPVQRPSTPLEQLEPQKFPGQGYESDEEPRTPDSVIRHPIAASPPPDSPGVPEPIATIKAPGGKLKTRPSITPADVQAMAETRRQVSNELPPVPTVPTQYQSRPSVIAEVETTILEDGNDPIVDTVLSENEPHKQQKRKSSLVPLDVPVSANDGLGFGLDKEFDRVIEAQKVASHFLSPANASHPWSPGTAEHIGGQEFKPFAEQFANKPVRSQKGYLMRQNTKVVVASSASHESAQDTTEAHGQTARGTRSAGNSPRKPSQQTWTTEPWNGKIRRKSVRLSGGSPQKKQLGGPAPPLPGQPSNVATALDSVAEDQMMNGEDYEDGTERGRLFVKVLRVKDLDLPLPKGERSYFALTLDNGLHCVTTAWLELGKTAPIGQEFELVVLNDLEFQLTLQTKLEEPKAKPILESPTKLARTPKASTFSRVFASPKKRKELELKQQEEAQRAEDRRQQEAQAKRRAAQPTAWDLLHGLVAKDGSFARSYICLKDHETNAYGKPYTVDVPCFNEWATEETHSVSSVKSKRSTTSTGVQRKAPYRIGKLELQLLFVPKPKGAKDEDMPKSMNACIRELKEAEANSTKSHEGHLSQQGGDCPFWRRRFFTLNGSKFTAYHEATRQPRATINLAKASKLIDDKTSLMQKEASGKGGGRRKSAFAEEEEGYMFVEEGFRIRFANGETIDFYADSAAEKDGWMKVLADVVGKDTNKSKQWTDLVLAKKHRVTTSSQTAQAAAAGQQQPPSPTKSAPNRAAPPAPAKSDGRRSEAPPPVEKDARHSMIEARRANNASKKTRSMIF
ncbi:MAG: hypothetical protein Q9195_009465 [Heterodermia aff. obscurata]